MIKKNREIFYTAICILFFLCLGFFYLSVNKALALEVQYPTLPGTQGTITSTTTLPDYVVYLYRFGMFAGFFSVFISLVIAGAMYILSPVNAEIKASAKDRVSGAISGLLILALSYLIITTINPQLSILSFNELPPVPPPPAPKQPPGIYFYEQSECSDSSVLPVTSDVADFDELKNKINSVGIEQGSGGYITILYDAINFQGKCLYLNPTQSCQSVDPWASSASILSYNRNYNGNGVSFFRKSYFNSQGGKYDVKGSQIGGGLVLDLSDPNLRFQGVPEEEQDCVMYDDNGKCARNGRQPPSLGGDNITSIKINGNYFVLFIYKGPQDNQSGPWTYCQAFPTSDDANKIGPQQIKWENIRNHGNVVPNYVMIIPIQR